MPLTLDNSGDWAVVDGTTTITLQRQMAAKDSSGGPILSWATVGGMANVPCEIQPASSTIRERFAQLALVVHYTIFLSKDVGARANDRFIGSDGRFYLLIEGGYEAERAGATLTGWPAVAHVIEVPNTP